MDDNVVHRAVEVSIISRLVALLAQIVEPVAWVGGTEAHSYSRAKAMLRCPADVEQVQPM